MNPVDVAIVLLLVLSAALGFRSGLIRSVCSLLGLFAGVVIASWNYKWFADVRYPLLKSRAASEAVWFCLIALMVMVVSGLLGMLIKKLIHGVGLGWLDRGLGLIFGLLRGALLAIVCIVVLAAFFPDTRWLGDARVAPYFLSMTHVTTRMTPRELEAKIGYGLGVLEENSPKWLKPK